MKIIDILKESKQVGLVYHFTGMYYAFDIIKENILLATSNHNSLKFLQKKLNLPYKNAVSTTRDKNFETSRVRKYNKKINSVFLGGGTDVVFCIDGDKLSEKYLTMPYDDFYDNKQKGVLPYLPENDEMEQLWYGKKIDKDGGISNFSNYIKYVEIQDEYTDKLNVYTSTSGFLLNQYEMLKNISNICNEKNIELRFENKKFTLKNYEKHLQKNKII
jgi:hypothetical protein